jgi:predicted TIM-barrel enzyme
VKELRGAIDAPIIAGSGLTRENAAELAAELDGAIVGTSIKENGAVDAPVDVERVRELVAAFS